MYMKWHKNDSSRKSSKPLQSVWWTHFNKWQQASKGKELAFQTHGILSFTVLTLKNAIAKCEKLRKINATNKQNKHLFLLPENEWSFIKLLVGAA